LCPHFEKGSATHGWRPGQEASLAPPYSSLRFSKSKFTVLKKVGCDTVETFRRAQQIGLSTHVVMRRPVVFWYPGNCAPLPPIVTPLVLAFKT